jgi:hypothetical protein
MIRVVWVLIAMSVSPPVPKDTPKCVVFSTEGRIFTGRKTSTFGMEGTDFMGTKISTGRVNQRNLRT